MSRPTLKELVVLGWCYQCEQFVEGITGFGNGLPNHSNQRGEHCDNSGFSAQEIKYRVDSEEQAIALANTILEDDLKKCLYGAFHSINCGDRRKCSEERSRWAKALAEYLLTRTGNA